MVSLGKKLLDNSKRLQASAAIGRAEHARFSLEMWQAGHIGATQIPTSVPIGGKLVHYIDGAFIDRVQRTIQIVERKPISLDATIDGHAQLDRYLTALKTKRHQKLRILSWPATSSLASTKPSC